MQLLASKKWRLQIADVEGAFLRGEGLHPSRGRIFIAVPPGGIPGLEDDNIIEAVKTVYGLADAPKAWWRSFSNALRSLNLVPSRFDPCVFFYHTKAGLSGVVSLHVDDMCLGGDALFESEVLVHLKKMYPFKHWKTQSGEFLGKQLQQLPDMSIRISQEEYASQVQSIVVSRE